MIFYLFLFILGLSVGSFLNVLIDRLPQEQSILGRSHCDHCNKKLQWYDLIPVISFLLLNGRCRYCRKKLSIFYPFIELLTGVMFILTWLYLPTDNLILKIMYLGLLSSLIAIFFADAKYQIIPDSLQVVLFIISFLIFVIHGFSAETLVSQIKAAVFVMTPILGLFLLTKGRGMGFGDVKLSFTIGFFCGLAGGFLALYVGFVTGALMGIFLIFSGKKKLKSKIAFGPFLVLGIITNIFFHEVVFSWLRKIYHF